ncbi:MAG: hypothetical protein RIR52_1952, partial [Acidobacteriota bacterium]
ITSLQKKSNVVRLVTFGQTEEGRDLPLMILSDPPVMQPLEARQSGKPLIFIMANIHAGEVEGKEAMLQLSRRLVTGDLRPLLRKLVILIAPIYNADGNERIDPKMRTAQHGPINGVGTRENARGLDLNRDYMKLESVEARALVGLMNRWDPHLTVDLHTSNGSYHGYHLTYSPMLNPNADQRLIDYERQRMLPAINRALRRNHGFRSYYYGNFATVEKLNREVENFELQRSGRAAQPAEQPLTPVWRTFDHRPMFGNNYVGLRNRLTILSEAYSYLEFRKRVEVTEAFVEEILKYSSLHSASILSLLRRVDEDLIRGKGRVQGIDFEIAPLDKEVPILVGEVEKRRNPISGREMTVMVEEKATPTLMPDYGIFKATRSSALPAAYILPPGDPMKEVLANLRLHGVAMEELREPLTVETESFTIAAVNRATRVFQGHREIRLRGKYATEKRTWPSGSILIRTTQSSAALIFYLLEPESDCGYVRWNFLDRHLDKGAIYPVSRITTKYTAVTRLID